MLKELKMDIAIGVICFLVGIAGTLGVQQATAPKANDRTPEVLEALKHLESELAKAEAKAIVSLTETDLLKVPCSSEYIEKNGETLCREMFCRMNRQGKGDGSTAQECDAISNTINSKTAIDKCMVYWTDDTSTARGLNQNSKYAQCISLFEKRK
jgi:hypothetical protein